MDKVIDWFASNEALIIDFAVKLLVAIAILVIGRIVARMVSGLITKIMTKKGVDSAVISFAASMTFGLAYTVVVIAAISHLGFNTSSLVAIIGAAGLAIGLALQGSLSNFASGVLIITLRPFKSGDFVEVAGVSGVVEEILIFSTKLRTGDNKAVIIPNGSITGGTITNFSAKPTRRIDLVIGVSYEANLADTKKVLNEVVSRCDLILEEPGVTIAVSELADSSVNLVVRPWVKSENYWPVYFELTENIKVALDEAGIEIPYPQLTLHTKKEENNES